MSFLETARKWFFFSSCFFVFSPMPGFLLCAKVPRAFLRSFLFYRMLPVFLLIVFPWVLRCSRRRPFVYFPLPFYLPAFFPSIFHWLPGSLPIVWLRIPLKQNGGNWVWSFLFFEQRFFFSQLLRSPVRARFLSSERFILWFATLNPSSFPLLSRFPDYHLMTGMNCE